MVTSWISDEENRRLLKHHTARKKYIRILTLMALLTALTTAITISGIFDDWIYWVGSWKLGIAFEILFLLLTIRGYLHYDKMKSSNPFRTVPKGKGLELNIFLIASSFIALFIGSTPATVPEHYISEEHQLAAAANHPGTQTTGEVFASINTTTEDTTGTLHYIRIKTTEDGRQAKTLHTWPMDEIKIFEDATTPVEKHHHTRQIATNPYTGEQKVMADTLDYVEISVPAESVANNYTIDVTPSS